MPKKLIADDIDKLGGRETSLNLPYALGLPRMGVSSVGLGSVFNMKDALAIEAECPNVSVCIA